MERDFFTMLDQALTRLHSHGRVTYNALQLQFHLDDAHLATLVVPLFAGLLSVPLPAEGYAALTLTPQQQKQQTLEGVMHSCPADAPLAVWNANPTPVMLAMMNGLW